MDVIGYTRVSTQEQAASGAGIDAQRNAIIAECDRRDWTLIRIAEDLGASGRDLRRPGIQGALEDLRTGVGQALIAAKLDRLSRSMLDFAGLMAAAQQQGWALIALDVSVDTSTPSGEAMAHIMSSFAQLERRLIGERTKDALAVRRAQGVRLGRPPTIPQDVAERIRREHIDGRTQQEIADRLNDDQVPTPRGGKVWRPSSLQALLACPGPTLDSASKSMS